MCPGADEADIRDVFKSKQGKGVGMRERICRVCVWGGRFRSSSSVVYTDTKEKESKMHKRE